MIEFLKKRFLEPSTYAGLALVAAGLGQAFKFGEVDAVARALEGVAEAAAVSPDPWTIAMALLGAVAVALRDPGH